MLKERFATHFSTTLSGGITDIATSLSVASAAGLPTTGNFRIIVDAEIMLVTGVSGTTLTVTRAQEGTSGAAHNDGVAVNHILTAGSLHKTTEENLAIGTVEGRLTLASATPITTTDQTAKTTVYLTPYLGNRIGLYDGTRWRMYPTAEISLALGTLTADKNYDVFAYRTTDDAVVLELSAAWTSDSARADALTTQDGVLVKSGAVTRRYLGTIRMVTATTVEDSALKRCVWNYYNRVRRHLFYHDAGDDQWTYNSTTPRLSRALSTALLDFVVGIAGIWYEVRSLWITTGAVSGVFGVGVGNTTPVQDARLHHTDNIPNAPQSVYSGYAALGYTSLNLLEWATSANTYTNYNEVANGVRSGWVAMTEG